MGKYANLIAAVNAGCNVPKFGLLDDGFTDSSKNGDQFVNYYKEFNNKHFDSSVKSVSVRSSSNISTPGLMRTILRVPNTSKNVYNAIKTVRNSFKNPMLLKYLEMIGCTDFQPEIIIQEMIGYEDAEQNFYAGVVSTHDVITHEEKINGYYIEGFTGDLIMSGHVQGSQIEKLKEESYRAYNNLIRHLVKTKSPYEMEFVIKDNLVYVLQIRLLKLLKENQIVKDISDMTLIGEGMSSSPMSLIGNITTNISNCHGKILLLNRDTTDEDVEILTAKAIITTDGNQLCHLATLCRSVKIPCILSYNGLIELQYGEKILINRDGKIYK